MNDGSSWPQELDACHRLIEQLSAQLEETSAQCEQLSARVQTQEVELQRRFPRPLIDSHFDRWPDRSAEVKFYPVSL